MLLFHGKSIQGVAFDLEGTIIDLEPLHFAAHLKTAQSLGITLDLHNPETFTKLVPHFIGGPDKSIMEELLALAQQKGTWEETTEQARQKKLEALSDYNHSTYRNLRDANFDYPPREGFLEFLNELRSANIPAAIGSLTDDKDAWLLLARSGLDKLFSRDKVILRGDVTRVKPDPEVYQKTAERIGIPPSHQLVFEDSHNGIRAAREAGSLAIAMPIVDKPEITARMQREGAVGIFKSWKDVTLDRLKNC